MTNYLYNGVELPALPEWDKEKYPYAAIVETILLLFGDIKLLYFSSTPLAFSADGGASTKVLKATDNGHGVKYVIDPSQNHTEWTYSEDVELVSGESVTIVTGGLTSGGSVTWCNYDMTNYEDGSLHLAASDPVPVGVLSWQKHDAYKPNTEWDGKTFYRVMGKKWVKQDAVVPAETLPEPEPIPIYGVEWDYSQSSTKLARTDDAVTFSDPAPATTLTDTGTSPFDNVMPWYGMKRETIGTDEMVYIPMFYYKVTDDTANSKIKWQITYAPQEGFALHPGSGRYISRYHVSADYASVSGAMPMGGKTRATFRQNSHAKGDKWWLNDVATWSAIQILYLVEFADWNCQSALGRGQTSGALVATGATDTAAYHTIKRDGASNQYRWIENPYSNMRDWLDGSVNVSNRVWVGTDNAAYTDTTSGYTDTGLTIPASSGSHIKQLGISAVAPWMFIPTAIGGSGSTYIPDYSIGGSGTTLRVVGGKSSYAAEWGVFMYDSNDSVSFTAADVGARLIYIP